METYGQGCETVSTFQDEPEELSTVHTRHTARHLSAAQVHLHTVWEWPFWVVQQWAFQCFHFECDTKMQTSHQIIQRGQGENVWWKFTL